MCVPVFVFSWLIVKKRVLFGTDPLATGRFMVPLCVTFTDLVPSKNKNIYILFDVYALAQDLLASVKLRMCLVKRLHYY